MYESHRRVVEKEAPQLLRLWPYQVRLSSTGRKRTPAGRSDDRTSGRRLSTNSGPRHSPNASRAKTGRRPAAPAAPIDSTTGIRLARHHMAGPCAKSGAVVQDLDRIRIGSRTQIERLGPMCVAPAFDDGEGSASKWARTSAGSEGRNEQGSAESGLGRLA